MHTMSTPLISGIIFILLYCANGGVNNGVQEYFGVQVVTSPKISQTSSPKVIHVERALFDNGNVKKNNTMTDVMNNIASAANQTNKTENDLAITSKPGQVDIETMTIIPKKIRDDIVQSGALLRGFYVFLGLSLLIIMYLFFRSNRLVNIEITNKLDKCN